MSKAHTFFNAQKKKKKTYSKEQKLQVMKEIEGKSSRETDQLFASIDPVVARGQSTLKKQKYVSRLKKS